jgi:hypothetical protein
LCLLVLFSALPPTPSLGGWGPLGSDLVFLSPAIREMAVFELQQMELFLTLLYFM